jgi:hypothetical protein
MNWTTMATAHNAQGFLLLLLVWHDEDRSIQARFICSIHTFGPSWLTDLLSSRLLHNTTKFEIVDDAIEADPVGSAIPS